MNISSIRYLVRAEKNSGGKYPRAAKKGMYYRKGSFDLGSGWYDNPVDATLFTAAEIKNVRFLNHGLKRDEVKVIEVDVTVTDRFMTPEDVNAH